VKNIWHIALITMKEGLRQRILYGITVASLLLTFFAVFISGLFMRDVLKILLDICLSAISLGGLLTPFFLSINLLSGDVEKRTIYTLISRNISRNDYILGKFLGLALLTGLVMTLLMLSTLLAVYLASLIYPPYFFTKFSAYPILLSTFMAFLGIQVLNSTVFLWCSLTTGSLLATLLTISSYIIGHSVEDVVRFLALKIDSAHISPLTEWTAKTALYIFPNLSAFDLKQKAVYGLTIPLTEIIFLCIYGLAYISIMLLLASFFFRRRDLP
jgi:ABC-type transport system involved in multi-copper enzyme maturation permease subunit